VNDIIRENGKTAAMCAGAAFLLSLLVGLIARNPFGVVLLRAFLLAVLFAGLGGGARFLIAKFLPDLLSGAGVPSVAQTEEGERGSRVNIVLPEESVSGGRVSEARAAATADGNAGSYDEPTGAGEPATPEEAQALSELAGELADEMPPTGYRGAEAGRSPDEVAEAESEYEPVDEEEVVEMEHAALGGSSAPLDSLPDISGIEMATEEQPAASSGPRTPWRAGGKETPSDAMKGALSGQDPVTLAKAIRTVLKKDEKG
jgi:hypothetical protein